MEEGYITIATNRQAFVEIAMNLILSIKLRDEKRPVALMYDRDVVISKEYKKYIDFPIKIKDKDRIFGTLNKFLLYKYTPFERTIFVDADCLIAKKDMPLMWKKLRKHHFTGEGYRVYDNIMWELSIKKLRQEFNIPYVTKISGGVIYFDKSELSENVFKRLNGHRMRSESAIIVPFRGAHRDEPLLGVVMSEFQLEPFPVVFRNYSQIKQLTNVVPLSSPDTIVDVFKGVSRLKWDTDYCSPTIVHFAGFCNPMDIYLREANRLREHFKVRFIKAKDISYKLH